MAGYVIPEVDITDPAVYGEFLERVTSTVENHGGKFIARGGAVEVIEGDWTPPRIAILEFDNVEQAKTWLKSPEYSDLDEIRRKSSNLNMIVVEGL